MEPITGAVGLFKMIEALEGPFPDPYAVCCGIVIGPIPTGAEITPTSDDTTGARAPESTVGAAAAATGVDEEDGVDAFAFKAGDALPPFARPLPLPFGLPSVVVPAIPDSAPAVGSETDSTSSSRKSYWRFCATRRFLKRRG